MTALRLRGVRVVYSPRRAGSAPVAALDGVDLAVEAQERVALVGRSGAGKSTVARLATGLVSPAAGTVEVVGQHLADLSRRELRRVRRRVQTVFQDPYDSLHPGMRVADLVAEPLAIAGVPRHLRVIRAVEALEVLGLHPAADFLHRHPGSLSGGQRQRVALARTLVASPELILADEPASMLDASLRATVTAQILEVQRAVGATLVFITHDLALARRVADRIVVLEQGRIIEDGPTEQILADPAQEETRVLLAAARATHPI